MPKTEFDMALAHSGQAREGVQLFWMGWHEVAASLRDVEAAPDFESLPKHEATVVRDLLGILKARGIRPDAELQHFPLADINALPDIDAWLNSWPLASRSLR